MRPQGDRTQPSINSILIPPFVRCGQKIKPHVLFTGKWGFISFIQGLRVSRLLDLREGYGPKTVKPGYSNGKEKTRKTEIGDQSPGTSENSRNIRRMERWKNGWGRRQNTAVKWC